MRDQDDRLTLFAQTVEDAEQLVRFRRRQNARRLVEDQDIGAAVERFQDFDALLHADADLFDDGIGINVKPVFVSQRFQLAARFAQRGTEEEAILDAQNDVFENGKILDQFEMLEDHPDTGCNCRFTVGDFGLFAVDPDFSGVGFVEPVEDRHER